MAFISVQSDAVRSGEDLRLDVSKGLAKTGTKAGNNLEIVFLTMQKNHREMMDVLKVNQAYVMASLDADKRTRKALYESQITKFYEADETLERVVSGIDLLIQFLERAEAREDRRWPVRLKRWVYRTGMKILGREK